MYGQFFVLFALVFSGYFLRKVQVINQGMADGLHSFISYFAFPCLLVYKIGTLETTSGLAAKLLLVTLLSCASFLLYALFARMTAKALKYPPRVSAVAQLAMAAPNNGFMGFPIALLFFGQHGLFLIMGHNIALNLFIFTYGLALLRRNAGRNKKVTFRSAMKVTVRFALNPNILAMLGGFVIYFGGLSLDNSFGIYLDYMAALATPLAMMFIGATLAGSNVLDLFRNRIVWESAAVKLLFLPMVIAAGVFFLPIDPMIKGILIIATALPTAAIVPVVCKQEGQDALMASKIVFFTTVLSMVTVPLWMKIIHLLLPL